MRTFKIFYVHVGDLFKNKTEAWKIFSLFPIGHRITLNKVPYKTNSTGEIKLKRIN